MGSKFLDNLPVLEIVGQGGTLRDKSCASARYLSCKLNKFAKIYKIDEDLLEYINPISVLYCEIDTEKIKHPDVLGSILNLGIDRSTIGDIVIKEGKIEFACLEEISDFLY